MSPDAVDVFIMIIGPGDGLFSRFGHSALWIKDEVRGTDVALNYGLSNTQRDGFFRRLTMRDVISRPLALNPFATIQGYLAADRSVEILELNLSKSQKSALLDYLGVDRLAEGKEFLYDFYLANCTTPLRDAIDNALAGQLRAATEDRMSEHTYRSLTASYVADDLALSVGLAVGLGQSVDKNLSAWEEMFLPFTLRDRLLAVQISDDDGRSVPLVLSHTITQATERPSVGSGPVQKWSTLLMFSLVLGIAMAFMGQAAAVDPRARLAFRLIGTGWLFIAGTLGAVLTGLWGLTGQHWVYANENVLQVNPLLLVVAFLLWGSRPVIRYLRWLMLSLAAMSIVGVLLKLIPAFFQANESVMALMAPAHIGLAWGLWRMVSTATEHADSTSSF